MRSPGRRCAASFATTRASSRDALKAEHGLDELEPLNWNEDRFEPPRRVLEAAAAEVFNAALYPERLFADFRDGLAGWLGVPPECVTPAHGAQALISSIAHVFIGPGTPVVVPNLTYGLYATGVGGGRGDRHARSAGRPRDRPRRGRRGGHARRLRAWSGSAIRTTPRARSSSRPPGPPSSTACRPTASPWRTRPTWTSPIRPLRADRPRDVLGGSRRDRDPVVLQDLRPGGPAPRLRDLGPGGGEVARSRAGAVQRQPRGARRGPRRSLGRRLRRAPPRAGRRRARPPEQRAGSRRPARVSVAVQLRAGRARRRRRGRGRRAHAPRHPHPRRARVRTARVRARDRGARGRDAPHGGRDRRRRCAMPELVADRIVAAAAARGRRGDRRLPGEPPVQLGRAGRDAPDHHAHRARRGQHRRRLRARDQRRALRPVRDAVRPGRRGGLRRGRAGLRRPQPDPAAPGRARRRRAGLGAGAAQRARLRADHALRGDPQRGRARPRDLPARAGRAARPAQRARARGRRQRRAQRARGRGRLERADVAAAADAGERRRRRARPHGRCSLPRIR